MSDDLPTFKFELEKSKGRVIGGSYGNASVFEKFPRKDRRYACRTM